MSFLLVIEKTQLSTAVRLADLEKRMCPYNLDIQVENLNSKIKLYYNHFSEFKNSVFKTPAGHKNEINSAWVDIIFNSDQGLQIITDPMGQCPIWFAETDLHVLISPEQKTFSSVVDFEFKYKSDSYYLNIFKRSNQETDFLNIQRLKPGSVLTYKNDLKIIEKKLPWESFKIENDLTLNEAQDRLKIALLSTSMTLAFENSCSFLSGGIDSSVATYLAKKYSGLRSTYNLKTNRGSEQLESEETSNYLNTKSQTLNFNNEKINSYFEKVIYANEIYDGLTAEIILQLEALIDLTPHTEKNIFTGYGADLIFGGMLAHKAYLAATGVSDTVSLLDRTYWSKELSPFYYWSRGIRLFHTFWNPAVMNAALAIPLSMQEQHQSQKYVLRSMAVKNSWLTESLAFRKKLGMTNGTNMNFIFSEHLKLPNEYSYEQKTEISFKKFKNIFDKTA